MSENTLPLLPSADELGDDEQPSSSRRVLLGLGGLAVVAVAAGALLLSGGGEDDIALGPPPGAPVAPVAAASATPSPTPSPPTTTAVTAARNPFAALQLSTGGASGAAPAGGEAAPSEPQAEPALPSSDPDSVVPLPGDGLVDDDPVDDGPGVELPPGGVVDPPTVGPVPEVPPSKPTVEPTPVASSLVLADVGGTSSARTATFTIDGSDEVVAVGAAFGPGGVLRLLSLQQGPDTDGWTAVLQSGQGEPFDVVLGTPVALP